MPMNNANLTNAMLMALLTGSGPGLFDFGLRGPDPSFRVYERPKSISRTEREKRKGKKKISNTSKRRNRR